jgi:lipopolysaccharide assembly outer membrane protein LptD (OstA)
MRVWSWAAAGALIAVTAASCLDRSASHRANAQVTPATQEPAAKASAPAEDAKAPSSSGSADAAKAEAPAEETTHEIILEHADRARYDNKTKDYSLTGDVVLRHEDGVLRAQTVQMNGDTKKGFAVGGLSFADQQTTLTANRMEIDFDARTALFKGDVRMVTQKKPEAEGAPVQETTPANAAAPGAETKQAEPKTEAPVDQAGGQAKEAASDAKDKGEKQKPFREYWQDRTEIRCPELEYSYREHRAVARGGITARQKDRSGRADEAVYTDRDELLVLSGNVEMKDERGQTFRAKKITISVKEDWLEAEGAIGSRFLVEEEKGEGEGKGGEKAGAGAKEAEGKAPSAPAAAGAPAKEGAGK